MNALVYACSDKYSFLAGVSLLSCLKNSEKRNFDIYILDDGITDNNKEKINEVANGYNTSVNYIRIKEIIKEISEEGLLVNLKNEQGVSYTTYARLLIGKLLPKSVTRIVYIDCDTLVVGNIDSLFHEDLHEKIIGMACDLGRAEYRKVIKVPMSRYYYSAGIMLVDLEKWRINSIEKIVFEKIQKGEANYPLVDQDIINVLLYNYIYRIPAKYNLLSQTLLYSYSGLKKVYNLNETNYYNQEEFEDSRNNPVVYHFSGATLGRPWYRNSRHPLKSLYDEYYYNSPWKNRNQEENRLSIPYIIQERLYWLKNESLSVLLGRVMQRFFIIITYSLKKL